MPDMKDSDEYTTVGRFERLKRDAGESINGNWLRDQMAEGKIPSIVIAGNRFAKTADLIECWAQYGKWKQQQKPTEMSARAACLSVISAQLHRIEERIRKIETILEA